MKRVPSLFLVGQPSAPGLPPRELFPQAFAKIGVVFAALENARILPDHLFAGVTGDSFTGRIDILNGSGRVRRELRYRSAPRLPVWNR